MFLIMLIGVLSDERPEIGNVWAPWERGVQSLFAQILDHDQNTLVKGTKGHQDFSERAIFVLLVEAFVDLIHSRESWHKHRWLGVGENCLKLVQQIALPAGEVGNMVFSRPGASGMGYSHLCFTQGSEQGFESHISCLNVRQQHFLLHPFHEAFPMFRISMTQAQLLLAMVVNTSRCSGVNVCMVRSAFTSLPLNARWSRASTTLSELCGLVVSSASIRMGTAS